MFKLHAGHLLVLHINMYLEYLDSGLQLLVNNGLTEKRT